jgi:hypothetical protein
MLHYYSTFQLKTLNILKYHLELGIEGKVYVQFVIGTDGSVGSVTIVRGVDDYLDKEAVRVVSTITKLDSWQAKRKSRSGFVYSTNKF